MDAKGSPISWVAEIPRNNNVECKLPKARSPREIDEHSKFSSLVVWAVPEGSSPKRGSSQKGLLSQSVAKSQFEYDCHCAGTL